MEYRRGRCKRKAIAGILATVIMFAMIFTVGASYFLFNYSLNGQYVRSLTPRMNNLNSMGSESLLVTTELLTGNNHVAFYVNNTGGLNANITTVLVYSSTGTPLQCLGKGLPSGACTAQGSTFSLCANSGCSSYVSPAPTFVVDNVGKGTSVVDTGYTYSGQTVTVKVITARGNVFSQTYPLTGINNPVPNALIAGGVGDLYLAFTNYKSWTITTTGCSTSGDFSGYCLSSASNAFSIPANNQCYSTFYCQIFSVRVTDLNQQRYSIQLSQVSLFYQLYQAGSNGKAGYYPWYIISNSSSNLYKHFHVVNLTYNQPQTLIFGAASCLSANSGPNLATCSSTLSGTGWLIPQGTACYSGNIPTEPCGKVGVSFINPNGWELTSLSPTRNLAYSSINYAQNLAFISTLYV
jgi:flagellin-like protein